MADHGPGDIAVRVKIRDLRAGSYGDSAVREVDGDVEESGGEVEAALRGVEEGVAFAGCDGEVASW